MFTILTCIDVFTLYIYIPDSWDPFYFLHLFPVCSSVAAQHVLSSLFQPEVTSATVNFKEASAVVWTTPEVKVTEDWQKQCGEKLAGHLGTCGFESRTQGKKKKSLSSYVSIITYKTWRSRTNKDLLLSGYELLSKLPSTCVRQNGIICISC